MKLVGTSESLGADLGIDVVVVVATAEVWV
jgi:hypothetical protein